MDKLGVFHVKLLIHILTKVEVGVVKPSSKIFLLTVPRRTSFVEYLCYLCLVFFMRSRLFIAVMWSPAGKGLTSWLLFVTFNCVFVTFLCGILGQMLYLIVSIPDLCRPFLLCLLL